MEIASHLFKFQPLAAYFHGEQLIPIFAGAFLLCIATLTLLSWVLVRYFKRRIGKKAYWLAPVPFLLACVVLFAEFEREKPNEGPPKVIAATRLSGMIKSLPEPVPFSIAGIAFFDGNLYIGTNLGMVEVSNGKVSQAYQFQSRDSVVSGPWIDRANHLLWAMDDHTQELLRFDGKTWTRMEEPLPVKGYLSRGDVLEGVKPIGNAEGFWLASAGAAWKWDSASLQWQQIAGNLPRPESYSKVNEIIGVLPIGRKAFLIIRHQPLAFTVRSDDDFLSDEIGAASMPTSAPIARDVKPFLADTWAVTQDAGYICTKDQTLIRITEERISNLDTPGACDAITSDEQSNLLISVRAKGIFRYAQGSWTLIATSPYPTGAGEYWAYLSAPSGQLAFAIHAKPVVDSQYSSSGDMRFIRNAPTSLWIFKDGAFSDVIF